MLRNVIGIVTGVVIAVLTVMLFEWISHTVFPPPADLDTADSVAMSEYMKNASVGALLLVLAGYIVATFDGTFVACLIGRTNRHILAIVVGGLMLVATVSTLIMIPHPLWFTASAPLGIVVTAWLALKLAPTLPQPSVE